MTENKKEAQITDFNTLLNLSKRIVGYLYPIIVDKDTSEVVDGKHRLEVDPRWPRREVEFKSAKERRLCRIHANLMRRQVSRKERQSQLIELASYLEDEGVPREQIAQKVVELVPDFSPKYVINLLPAKYKAPKKRAAGVKGAEKRIAIETSKTEAKPSPIAKPKPKPLECPSCHIELETVLCPKCWSEIVLRRNPK
jgi:hypothetical protein